MERNKIIKTIGIVTIVGGCAYVLYRAYKEYKKDTEPKEVITMEDIKTKKQAEEAEKVMEEHINEHVEEPVKEEDLPTVTYDEERKVIVVDDLEFDVEEVDDADEEFEEERYGILNRRGDNELRYNADSPEALEQYQRMVISDYDADLDMYSLLERLFKHRFTPKNKEDERVRRIIMEEREAFFGDYSKHNEVATITELLVHYANKLSYDFEVDIIGCMKVILDALEIDINSGETELSEKIYDLLRHDFVNKDNRYGMFGLTIEDYNEHLLNYDNRNIQTNADISFYMEYNVFCNIYGDDFVKGF